MLLKNGLVLIKDSVKKIDIKIEGQKIVEIGESLQSEAETLNLEGKYVVPGGIDVHTHFNIDVGIISADDFESGSKAALAGGTTTIIDHPGFGPEGCSLDYMIKKYMEYGKKSHCDYSFHGVFQKLDEKSFEGLKKLKERGINSFKIYLTYTFKQIDGDILKIFEFAKALDMVVAVHAENDSIITYLKDKFLKEEKKQPIYHAYSRPGNAEAEAVSRLIKLADTIGFEKLYLVHISSKEALKEIDIAKKSGKKFFVETCTQYLYLNEEKYKMEDGVNFILSPPLRGNEDVKILWEHIKKNNIDIIATDHCSFNLKDKSKGRIDFTKCPNGIPGVQERNLIIFSEFLRKKVNVEEYLNLISTKPAEIFGLKEKGSIEIGKDADLVIFKEKENILDEKSLYSNAGYTCFKDFKLLAQVEKVFIRGNKVYDIDSEEIFSEKTGKFIPR